MKTGAGSWLLWQKDKVLQNFTGYTSKRWKNWRLISGRSCYQREPYLLDGTDGSSEPERLLTSG